MSLDLFPCPEILFPGEKFKTVLEKIDCMKVSGKLFSGMGAGEEYLSKELYQERFREILGYKPFPGTLNLRVDGEEVEEIRELESERLESFEHEDKEYSGMDIYRCEIRGIEAAYLDLDVTDYEGNVLEIVAPVGLRDMLGLEDGDRVEVEFET
jgi:riboflavin kinase